LKILQLCLMDDSLRKRNFYALPVKCNFESFAEFPGNIPLFEWLCIAEDFDDNCRIAKIVNS